MEDPRGSSALSRRWRTLAVYFVAASLASWGLNYLFPIFWNPEQRMMVPDRTLVYGNPPRQTPGVGPAPGDGMAPIVGVDIRWPRSLILGDLDRHPNWFMRTLAANPVAPRYAPGPYLFYWPFTLVSEDAAYRAISVLSVLSLAWLLLAGVPSCFPTAGAQAAGLVLLVSALPAYSLQWELERGQNNAVVLALAVAGLGLFHSGRTRVPRLAGLALLTFAAQAKIWPAILYVCAFGNLRDKRETLRTAAHLLWMNLALALSFGWTELARVVAYLVEARRDFQRTQPQGNPFDHSIQSFSLLSGTPAEIYYVVTLACLMVFGLYGWRRGGFWNPECLMLAGMFSYFLLGMSYEYKLVCLPVLLLLYGCAFVGRRSSGRLRIVEHVSAAMACFGLTQTLHPAALRGYLGPFSGSAFPSLFAVMIAGAALMAARWTGAAHRPAA
jgi:hypothetical protein